MSSDYIISVTDASFEYDVIAYSQNTPVVVDFWADWCKPCRVLTPILERLAEQSQGEFRLAKVDVDANPNLSLRFSVRSIPTVIAFSQGRKVSDFSGLVPEQMIRDFIARILPPRPSDLLAQKGNSLLSTGELKEAREAFLQALDLDGSHAPSTLGLMKISLLQGEHELTRALFRDFPPSPEYNAAEKLVPLMKAMEDLDHDALPLDTDLDAAFVNAIRLVTRGNTLAGIDGLLDVLRQEKHYRKDRARNILLALLELLDPEAELTRKYRAELASILF
jgi:putative thioredoxin